jgi:glycosyltransferase involved in cell wall biosynthesis
MDINSDKPLYSIVMPVFQSAAYIQVNVARVAAVMDAIGAGYEIILVDDNSSDDTWGMLVKLKATTPHLRIFRLARNVGITPATYAGALQANGEYIITLDDDLQHPPEEIPKLIAALNQNQVDIVFGNPENRHHAYKLHPALVWFGKFLFHQVYMRRYRKLFFFTTFRLFRASLLQKNGGPWGHLFFIWQLDPRRCMDVPTQHQKRMQGTSNHNFWKQVRHFAPFLYYFSIRTIWAFQVVLLIWVAFMLANNDKTYTLFIAILLMVALAVRWILQLRLAKMEKAKHTITES